MRGLDIVQTLGHFFIDGFPKNIREIKLDKNFLVQICVILSITCK